MTLSMTYPSHNLEIFICVQYSSLEGVASLSVIKYSNDEAMHFDF